MSVERAIHMGWDTHNDLPDTYRVFAECDDELTEVILINPTPELRASLLIPGDQQGSSPAYAELARDHLTRCLSCRKGLTDG